MPNWLYEQLARGPAAHSTTQIGSDGKLVTRTKYAGQVAGVMPVLARLSAASNNVEMAYLCHPSVRHVHRLNKDGPFCGYRNIQMLVSYIQGAKAEGYTAFDQKLPGVLDIQDMIETAWDNDICSFARAETGGIKGTRKWIGTPEVCGIES